MKLKLVKFEEFSEDLALATFNLVDNRGIKFSTMVLQYCVHYNVDSQQTNTYSLSYNDEEVNVYESIDWGSKGNIAYDALRVFDKKYDIL